MEILVALSAGAMVSVAAYTLLKHSTGFFQQETRLASAQIAASVGFARLQADLQRASYLSTPNLLADPSACREGVDFGATPGLAQLGALALEEGSTGMPLNPSLEPDTVIIGGSFAATELFPVRTVQSGAGGTTNVYLQVAVGPMARIGALGDGGSDVLAEIFRPGRILRLQDHVGRHEYGVIQQVVAATTGPIITLEPQPTIPFMGPGATCGVDGLGIGLLASVVSRIRYRIDANIAADPLYTALYETEDGGVDETDAPSALVREELDAKNNVMQGTRELVAEWAVDLKFGLTRATLPGLEAPLARHDLGAPEVYATATTGPTGLAQRIRTVQVRLVTRARVPDRTEQLLSADDGGTDGLYRYQLQNGLARTRVLVADVALPNHTGVSW